MADDDKPKGFDISQLGRNTEQFERHAKALEKYDKLFAKGSQLANAYEAMRRVSSPAQEVAEKLTRHTAHLEKTSQELAERIQAQQEGLARVSAIRESSITPPLRPDLTSLRNPVVERLERIEKQFDELAGVAAEGLGAGLALQEKADQFLNEFREAARDTSRSGKMAIGVSVVAILITTLVPLASSYFFPDRGAAAMEKSIADMQGQIVRMREEQAATAQKLIDALAAGDQATADAVGRALEQALSKGASEPSDATDLP